MSEDVIEVDFNAVRVCEAISRIGYEPHSAIMDLVDNSVAAGATSVRISLYLIEGKTLKSRNSVRKYQIVDNGSGMDESGIRNAFSLGASRSYPPNSLSKYGMGLKSAGLSLGSRISIVSKKDSVISAKYVFDTKLIEKNGLSVTKRALTQDELDEIGKLIAGSSGSVIEIEGCEDTNHSSPKSTVGKLNDRLGVVYYTFLSRPDTPLKIETRVCAYKEDAPFNVIPPKDMLFSDEAAKKTGWVPDEYDYVSPYLVLDHSWDSLTNKDGKHLHPIRIQAVAFPQAQLAQEKSPLSPDSKAKIRTYEVSRENKGFFIYRNGRLIRWGDDLDGIIGKDDINVRIRIELEDEHDDVLHVDVSKQRLEIDDELHGELSSIVSKALKTAKEIREACHARQNDMDAGSEGLGFSASAKNVAEDDPLEAGSGTVPPETAERKKKKADEAVKVIEQLKSEENKPEGVREPDVVIPPQSDFRKVRYSEKIPFGQLWKPFYDAKEGVFVCISRNHPFYEGYISRFGEGSKERLAIEAIIFAVGLGESNVVDNETNVEKETLDRVFRRLHQNIDRWLADWAYENPEAE
jgi:hypothetical protein